MQWLNWASKKQNSDMSSLNLLWAGLTNDRIPPCAIDFHRFCAFQLYSCPDRNLAPSVTSKSAQWECEAEPYGKAGVLCNTKLCIRGVGMSYMQEV
jgi:hypothetical protein